MMAKLSVYEPFHYDLLFKWKEYSDSGALWYSDVSVNFEDSLEKDSF